MFLINKIEKIFYLCLKCLRHVKNVQKIIKILFTDPWIKVFYVKQLYIIWNIIWLICNFFVKKGWLKKKKDNNSIFKTSIYS